MFSIQRVGERITEWRKARHMTQQELADKMHVSFQAVSNWERGSSMPDISKLPELAKILEVSIDRILAEDDIPVSPLSKNQTETTLPSCIVIPEADMPPVTVQAPRQAVSLPAPTPASPPDMPVDMQNLAGLVEIAPFLEQETLDQIALEIGQHPSPSDDFDILSAGMS